MAFDWSSAGRLRELRRDHGNRRQINLFRNEVGENPRELPGRVGLTKSRRRHVAQHGEIPCLQRIVEGDEAVADEKHDLLGVRHGHWLLRSNGVQAGASHDGQEKRNSCYYGGAAAHARNHGRSTNELSSAEVTALPAYAHARLMSPLKTDAATVNIVAFTVGQAHAEAAGDRDAVALGHEVVAQYAHERHAEGVGILEGAPVRRHAEPLVASQIGVHHGHRQRDARDGLIRPRADLVDARV